MVSIKTGMQNSWSLVILVKTCFLLSLHFGQVVRHGSIGPLGTGKNIIFKAVGRIVHTYAS